jgi:hypothetical protein
MLRILMKVNAKSADLGGLLDYADFGERENPACLTPYFTSSLPLIRAIRVIRTSFFVRYPLDSDADNFIHAPN